MNRTKFYNRTVVEVNGIDTPELDFLHNQLSSFVMNHQISYYRVDEHDVARPDLISYENYGTVRYWWIICLVNEIENPFIGIAVGDILQIPHISDIFAFYKRYRAR
jgi:hypothetical protein